jgi:hypothetical protein
LVISLADRRRCRRRPAGTRISELQFRRIDKSSHSASATFLWRALRSFAGWPCLSLVGHCHCETAFVRRSIFSGELKAPLKSFWLANSAPPPRTGREGIKFFGLLRDRKASSATITSSAGHGSLSSGASACAHAGRSAHPAGAADCQYSASLGWREICRAYRPAGRRSYRPY